MVVSDIEAAHAHLVDRGVDVSQVQDFPWGRFVFFSDPDGNRWAVQQIVYPEGARWPPSNSPSRTPARKARHSLGVNKRIGPDGSLESRTATWSSPWATSTQPFWLL